MENRKEKGIAAETVHKTKNVLTGEDSRIPEATAFLMIGTALFFDLLSIVPVVNFVAAFFAWMTFGLWFLIKGVGFVSPKKLATWAVAALIGLIPALSALPELTLAVAVTIVFVRAEDQLGIAIPKISVKESPVRGGRSKLAKVRRRASQTPEHNREAYRRLQRIKVNKNKQEGAKVGTPSFDGVTKFKPAWQN